jgi:hypothetical protein
MNLKTTALAASLMVLAPLSVQASDVETRLAKQEQRLDLLEQKMDKLLDLMINQAQGGGAVAPQANPTVASVAPAAAQPQAIAAAYKPGLILDIYQVNRPEDRKFPVEQKGANHFALGRMLHEGPAQFSLGQYMKRKELAPLGNISTMKLVAQEFHGAVQIVQSGAHVIGMELKRENKRWRGGECVLSLKFDGEELLILRSDTLNDFKVANQQLQLEPGMYDFSIWQVCDHGGNPESTDSNNYQIDPNKVTATLKIKAPGDWEASLVPAERLFHLQ